MEIKTPKEFFENVLPERFKPEKAVGIDVVAQSTLLAQTEADWVVIIKDQKINVSTRNPSFAYIDSEGDRQRLYGHSKWKIRCRESLFHGKNSFQRKPWRSIKIKRRRLPLTILNQAYG